MLNDRRNRQVVQERDFVSRSLWSKMEIADLQKWPGVLLFDSGWVFHGRFSRRLTRLKISYAYRERASIEVDVI